MEKRGVVDGGTPAEKTAHGARPDVAGRSGGKGEPTTKQAADEAEAHTTSRLADAASDAFRKKK